MDDFNENMENILEEMGVLSLPDKVLRLGELDKEATALKNEMEEYYDKQNELLKERNALNQEVHEKIAKVGNSGDSRNQQNQEVKELKKKMKEAAISLKAARKKFGPGKDAWTDEERKLVQDLDKNHEKLYEAVQTTIENAQKNHEEMIKSRRIQDKLSEEARGKHQQLVKVREKADSLHKEYKLILRTKSIMMDLIEAEKKTTDSDDD